MVAALAVVMAAGGTAAWWALGRDQASASTASSTTTTVAASTSTIEQSVSSTGTLTPTVQEDVSFEVSGTVTAVSVAEGDTVTVGQTLATVDTLQLNADLLDAKATLATAEAKLSDLEDEDDGTTTADAQISAATAQVAVAEAAVTTAEEAVADATLTAPVAGLVTAVDVEVGDKISGSSSSSASGAATGATGGATTSTTASTAQFTIVGTDAYQTSLTLADSDVAKIAVGDQVEMTSDDLADTVFGVVSSIGLISTSTSGTAGYPVVVDVTGDVSALRDGISVTAEIIYSRRTDVLTVPSAAVTQEDGTSYVQKVESDGTVTKTAVVTGETSGTVIEITSGLVEGDEVQVTTYIRTSTGNSSSGTTSNEQMPQFSGEMPDFSSGEMPAGGQMPGGNG
ncbi:MAG: biotin/lipoyl-binding protein [Cellulomonas sp.]|nr:biotin/lipoyl-binding protein [Cellulomonas sp.]